MKLELVATMSYLEHEDLGFGAAAPLSPNPRAKKTAKKADKRSYKAEREEKFNFQYPEAPDFTGTAEEMKAWLGRVAGKEFGHSRAYQRRQNFKENSAGTVRTGFLQCGYRPCRSVAIGLL